jgi:putative phosphoesterase
MKLLILSDIHHEKHRAIDIIEKYIDIDLIISLGDSGLKQDFFEAYDILAIKGNAPFDFGIGYDHEMTINKQKVLFIHGHKYNVRRDLCEAYKKLMPKTYDIVFYGHTHEANYEKIQNTLFINPGAIHKSRGQMAESYGIATFKPKELIFKWIDAKTHALLHETRTEL